LEQISEVVVVRPVRVRYIEGERAAAVSRYKINGHDLDEGIGTLRVDVGIELVDGARAVSLGVGNVWGGEVDPEAGEG